MLPGQSVAHRSNMIYSDGLRSLVNCMRVPWSPRLRLCRTDCSLESGFAPLPGFIVAALGIFAAAD